MLYARIDLTLASHPKAHTSGDAMATWTWALLYSCSQELDGFVPGWSLRLSWCGERAAKEHARRLVDTGLFVVDVERDGWVIANFSAKNETKAAIDERRRFDRDRKRNPRGLRPESGRNPVAREHGDSVGIPGSGSGSGSESREGVQGERPAWFDEALSTVTMTTGMSSAEAPALWLQYNAARLRKGWSKGREDAIGWLTTVLRSERREDAARKRPGPAEPQPAPRQTAAEAKAFADELAAKMRELKVGQ